jgi:hypothetical protein
MNINDDDLELVTLTVEQVRDMAGNVPNAELDGALDNMQGAVFGGDKPKSYVVIEIVP